MKDDIFTMPSEKRTPVDSRDLDVAEDIMESRDKRGKKMTINENRIRALLSEVAEESDAAKSKVYSQYSKLYGGIYGTPPPRARLDSMSLEQVQAELTRLYRDARGVPVEPADVYNTAADDESPVKNLHGMKEAKKKYDPDLDQDDDGDNDFDDIKIARRKAAARKAKQEKR